MMRKPMCKYGASCYQKNPKHLRRFFHPPKRKHASSESDSESDSASDADKPDDEDNADDEDEVEPQRKRVKISPPCRYGLKCFRQNTLHFDDFAHPPIHPMLLKHPGRFPFIKSTSTTSPTTKHTKTKPPFAKLPRAPSGNTHARDVDESKMDADDDWGI